MSLFPQYEVLGGIERAKFELPGDHIVQIAEIRVGDIMLGTGRMGDGFADGRMNAWGGGEATVTELPSRSPLGAFIFPVEFRHSIWGSRKNKLSISSNYHIWIRARDGAGQVFGMKKRSDDRFPHNCPRCGSKAYVGFNSVEHASGGGGCR